MMKWDEELSDDVMNVRLESRRLRRDALLARLGTLNISILLDESVFMRPIGGAEVLADQLKELLRLGEQNYATTRVIPFAVDAPLANNASFDLLYLGEDSDEGGVLYRENGSFDEVVEDRPTIARHRTRYNKLWEAAKHEIDTIEFIRGRVRTLEAEISRQREAR
jgi:hypothetical protein